MAATPTVKCPQCGRENRPKAKFCAGCGTSLQRPGPKQGPAVEKAPPSGQPRLPAPALPKEEAAEAAKRLWDWAKTVVAVGGRTAWSELTNPSVTLEGTVTETLKVDAVTPPMEPGFWWFTGIGLVMLVSGLSGHWLIPLIGSTVTLFLSWRRQARPYFSTLTPRRLAGLFGKTHQVPSLLLKVQSERGQTQVQLIGEGQGEEPGQGDRVQVWGIFDDKEETRLRAWKVQVVDEKGKPQGQAFLVPRLLPLAPTLFFVSTGSFLLALLIHLLF